MDTLLFGSVLGRKMIAEGLAELMLLCQWPGILARFPIWRKRIRGIYIGLVCVFAWMFIRSISLKKEGI